MLAVNSNTTSSAGSSGEVSWAMTPEVIAWLRRSGAGNSFTRIHMGVMNSCKVSGIH